MGREHWSEMGYPLMAGSNTKGQTYLSKPLAKSCRFVKAGMTFCYHQEIKG